MAASFLAEGTREGPLTRRYSSSSTTRRRTVPGRPRGDSRSGSGNRRADSSRRPEIADLHAPTVGAAVPVPQRLLPVTHQGWTPTRAAPRSHPDLLSHQQHVDSKSGTFSPIGEVESSTH